MVTGDVAHPLVTGTRVGEVAVVTAITIADALAHQLHDSHLRRRAAVFGVVWEVPRPRSDAASA
jgi:hypothetical protein